MKTSKNQRFSRSFCALILGAAAFCATSFALPATLRADSPTFVFPAPVCADSPPEVAPSPDKIFFWRELEDGSVVLGGAPHAIISKDVVVPAPPAGKRAAIGSGRFSEYPDDAIEEEIVNIETVVLPDGIQTIEESAFNSCRKLRSIRLPNDLETIEESAFSRCFSLKTVALPDGLETIGRRAFYSCSALTAFSVGENNRCFRAIDGVLFSKDGTELLRYPSSRAVDEYAVPDGVKKIADWAFQDARIKSITLPEGLETLDERAFCNCKATSIALPASLKSIGTKAFIRSCLTTVALPQNLEELAPTAFFWCETLESFEVDPANPRFRAVDGVLFSKDGTELLRYPPSRAAAEYVVPDGVKKIADEAFADCGRLTSISFPTGFESIGNRAFYMCRNLSSVSFSTGVKSVGVDAFYLCSKLKSVAFADGTQTPLDDWLRAVRNRAEKEKEAQTNR